MQPYMIFEEYNPQQAAPAPEPRVTSGSRLPRAPAIPIPFGREHPCQVLNLFAGHAAEIATESAKLFEKVRQTKARSKPKKRQSSSFSLYRRDPEARDLECLTTCFLILVPKQPSFAEAGLTTVPGPVAHLRSLKSAGAGSSDRPDDGHQKRSALLATCRPALAHVRLIQRFNGDRHVPEAWQVCCQ